MTVKDNPMTEAICKKYKFAFSDKPITLYDLDVVVFIEYRGNWTEFNC